MVFSGCFVVGFFCLVGFRQTVILGASRACLEEKMTTTSLYGCVLILGREHVHIFY